MTTNSQSSNIDSQQQRLDWVNQFWNSPNSGLPPPPPVQITSITSFNHKLNNLNTAVWGTVDKHVKLSKPSPYPKRWWSTDLAKEKQATTKLGHKAQALCNFVNHPIHEEYCQQQNRYLEHIKKAKAEHSIDWLEGLDETSMWQVSRFISSPPTDAARTCIPTLIVKDPITKCIIGQVFSNKDKGNLLHKLFFLSTNPNLTPPGDDYIYPPLR